MTTLDVHGYKLDAFTQAYLAAMLWSSGDDGEFDGVAIVDLPKETIDRAVTDCASFRDQHSEMLQEAYNSDVSLYEEERAGHDFWLTRGGHGTGFWDRGLGDVGDRLSVAADEAGSLDAYLGDDGLVYLA